MLKESPEEYLKKDRKECQVRTEFYPLYFGSAVDSCNPRSLQGIVCYRQNHLQKENLKIHEHNDNEKIAERQSSKENVG